jgi:hypothetical protein
MDAADLGLKLFLSGIYHTDEKLTQREYNFFPQPKTIVTKYLFSQPVGSILPSIHSVLFRVSTMIYLVIIRGRFWNTETSPVSWMPPC